MLQKMWEKRMYVFCDPAIVLLGPKEKIEQV